MANKNATATEYYDPHRREICFHGERIRLTRKQEEQLKTRTSLPATIQLVGLGQQINASDGKRPKQKRGRPTTDKFAAKRRSLIRQANIKNLRGQAYVNFLSDNGLPICFKWIGEGCPHDYRDAYKIKKWRDLMRHERRNYTRRKNA